MGITSGGIYDPNLNDDFAHFLVPIGVLDFTVATVQGGGFSPVNAELIAFVFYIHVDPDEVIVADLNVNGSGVVGYDASLNLISSLPVQIPQVLIPIGGIGHAIKAGDFLQIKVDDSPGTADASTVTWGLLLRKRISG